MDIKITKERISNHLEYDWFKYLLVIAAGLFVVLFSFGQIASDRSEEVFSMFFSAYGIKENDYSAKTLQGFSDAGYDENKYGANIMRKVTLDFVSPLTSEYGSIYSTRGVYGSDALIIPFSRLKDAAEENFYPASGFLPLDGTMLSDMGIDSGYELLRLDESFNRVEDGGTVYAVRVDNLVNINKLAVFSYEDNESEFYLVLNSGGGNVGKAVKGGNPRDRQTFFCLKMFFSLYGN